LEINTTSKRSGERYFFKDVENIDNNLGLDYCVRLEFDTKGYAFFCGLIELKNVSLF